MTSRVFCAAILAVIAGIQSTPNDPSTRLTSTLSLSGEPRIAPDANVALQDFSPILFVSRGRISDVVEDPGAIPGIGPVYRTAVVGGRLIVRESDGSLRTIGGPDQLFDVADPCVSWDGTRIVFSGVSHPDSNWRLFEVGADGTGLRQLTFTDRRIDLLQYGSAAGLLSKYDDFDPCYLPDGRIVFASTRYPSIASYDQLLTSNLFVLNSDEGKMHRITTERNGGEEPTIDPVTGRIVYARWWVNRDRPSNIAKHGITRDDKLALTDDIANIWQAVTIRSDGAELKLYAGFPRSRVGLQTYKPFVLNDGTLLGTFTPNTSMSSGIGGTGIRWFKKGADVEHHIIGVSSTDSPHTLHPPFSTDPVQFGEASILFSYNEKGDDFGIAVIGIDGTGLQSVIDIQGTHELEPQVLRARSVPPILREEFPYPTGELAPTEDPRTYFKNDTFRFDCMNIFTNGAVDEPVPDAPRITTGARIRFFMNVQRQNPLYPDPSIFLKDAEVFLGGAIHEHDLPADVPLFEQIVDKHEKVLETPNGKFAHVTGMNFDRMGSGTKCVGCHAGHSILEVPLNGSIAEWINVSPSASATASSQATPFNGVAYLAQRVVDRQARTGGDTVLWVADEAEGAWVTLSWELPVEVREFVLYGIPNDVESGTTISVQNCEILLYYGTNLVRRIESTGEIIETGTKVPVPPTDIDSATIVIKSISGTFRDQPRTGLAEVETIARISRLNYMSE